ncbi:MAG: M20/M25/M40 family metallo-hydrolase [Myxococcota bacterium]|nr:M20/M25/M40 family metallo-hydrolase [Myxococcota bacterium]
MLSAAIRIPTVNPPGAEAELARFFVAELQSSGIEARLVPTPSPKNGPLRAAAIARVRGSSDAPALLLLSHLDVVGTGATGWSKDPFEGAIRHGHVVGRGALDAKGLTVVHALALEKLARRERPLRRDVILLATPDEETGGADGIGWILRERGGLLDGVRFALTEGGSIADSRNKPPLWSVSIGEKSPCWLELRTRGTPGHAGTPNSDAAVPRLVAALERVRTTEWPVHVVPEVARMFRAMAPLAARRDQKGYRDLPTAIERDREFRRRFLRHPTNVSLVRTTVSITVLRGAPATNVAPAEAVAHLDARLLPGDRCDHFEARIRARINDPGVEIKRLLGFEARSSPIATPLFSAIERVASEVNPGSVVAPRVSAGSSDAHWLRERDIVVYGFIPRWLRPEDTRGIHGPDEKISIVNLERGARTLVKLIETFDELER